MRAQVRENLYQDVLNAVAGYFEEPVDDLCLRLKPAIYNLRGQYRDNAPNVDYGDRELSAAYMLGYYPHYVHMTEDVLGDARARLAEVAQERPLRVALLGGGPMPELPGLMEAVQSRARRPIAVELNVLDANSEGWRWAADISVRLARQYNPTSEIVVRHISCDFDHDVSVAAKDAVSERDLVLAQNCCNELQNRRGLRQLLLAAADTLNPQGFVVLADQANYGNTREAFNKAHEDLAARLEIIESADDYTLDSAFYPPPIPIRDLFFDGINNPDPQGNWPKGEFARRKLACRAVVACRR